ncbi:MAG: hypothetical protein AB9869_36630 [Verrucomicrobiia bacterium]
MADTDKDYVAWAKRVNGRWIVHQGLDERAKGYMDHLEETDPKRLERSCRLAYQLVRQAGPEDPKPWFYAGLFSLATVEEATKFFASHWFTLSAIPSLADRVRPTAPADSIGQAAHDKLGRIRQALADLLATSEDTR